MVKLVLTFIIVFISSHSFSKEAHYDDARLKKMPFDVYNTVKQTFLKHKFHPTLIGPDGSKLLGLNMLFSDDFFVSKIALKYNVTGKFDLGRTYTFGKFKVIHFEMNGTTSALMYQKVEYDKISSVINELTQIKTTGHSSNSLSIISKAYAYECFAPDSLTTLNINTDISENSASAMITKCFESMGDGVEESTVGMVKGAWSSISGEWNTFWSNPKKRLGEYYDYAATGVEALWDFSQTLGKMIIDPAYGSKILKEKFGEIGNFFVKVYNGVASMPLAQKVDLICNIIGTLGVDFLLAAVTAGAASGKLGITAVRLLDKLLDISRMIGKGLKYPFKVLEKFSEKTLKKLESIISSGNKDVFDRKLKRIGCAI